MRVPVILVVAVWFALTAASARANIFSETGRENCALWLAQHQNVDGSWGTGEEVKLLYTVESVLALRAMNHFDPAYYRGLVWLENHNAPNVDYAARRILALYPHGDNVQNNLSYLQTSQTIITSGYSGWGLTNLYQGAALDSAHALLAYSQTGTNTNIQAALNYLKTAQLPAPNRGWGIAQETTVDPVTTAIVVKALSANKSFDLTLTTNIADAVSALGASVDTTSPINVQAITALAYIKAGYSANATSLLNSLAASQTLDTTPASGSWSGDVYATALAAQALAAASGSSSFQTSLSDVVLVPDPNLRAAINKSLGKSSMDSITKGDLQNLTTLDAPGVNIADLTGLEWATNLRYLYLRDNKIASVTPLNGLLNLLAVDLARNLLPPIQSWLSLPIRFLGKQSFFSTFADAYFRAEDNEVIQSHGHKFTENFTSYRSISVTLQGGYGEDFSTQSGTMTILNGKMVITSGRVVAVNLGVQ
jgi:hypothetical protein